MLTLYAIFGLFITVKTSDISEIQVQTVRHGDDVIIKCDGQLLKDNNDNLVWYKQSFGKLPQYLGRKIKNTYRLNKALNDGRLNISVDNKRFDINIFGTQEEDIATYFCGKMLENGFEFITGTLLVFQAEKANHEISALTVIENEESTTLQCSVQAAASSCEDEQSVYLFKHGSGDSHTGIIYTHGNISNQCKRSSNAGFSTQTCSYTVHKSNLRPADTEIYYCAVGACGNILFGNGTKVDVKESIHWNVIALTISNLIFSIIIIVLVGVILKNRKGATNSNPNHTNQAEAENGLKYAAVSFAKKPSSSRIHSRVKTDQDIYAQVKIH